MFLTFSLPWTALAEIDRTHPPEGGALPAQSFPAFETIKLSNGLTVFLLASKRQPMITYRLLLDARPAEEFEPGTVELLAALINKGTAKQDAAAFAEATDFIGASIEADAGDDAFSIYASGLSKYQRQILELLTEAVTSPTLPAEHLEKERAKFLAQLESERKDPDTLAAKLRDTAVYGADHPYAHHATPESVAKISREKIEAFYRAAFQPANASMAVVGDFEPTTMREELEATLGKWAGEAVKPKPAPEAKLIQGTTIHLVDRPESVQSNVLVAKNGIPKGHPHSAEVTLLNAILGGGFSGRLFQNLREKNAFTYGSYSEFIRKRTAGSFSASAEVRNEVTAAAVQEIINELQRIVSEPIPEKELELNQNYVAGNYVMSLESDRRTADRIQELDFYQLSPDFYATFVQKIQAATPEKLQTLAQELLKPENLAIIVVGKASEIRPQLEKLGKVIVYDENLKPLAE